MAQDLYEFLVGGAPKQADIPAVVDQLRRRRALGELGAITGDRVLQPFGSGLIKQTDQYANEMQDVRQKDADNAQTAKYQDAQTAHQAAVLEATLARDKDNADYRRRMADAANLRAQAAKDKVTAPPKRSKLRTVDIKELQDLSGTISGMDEILKTMDSGVKLGTKEVMGVPIPGSRVLANTMAGMGMGSKEDKDSFALFQEWDRLYNLAERNRLFGATLSTNEQKAWNNANPSVLQTDEQIRAAIPTMQKIFKDRLAKRMRGLEVENYDPEAIWEYAGMGSPPAEGEEVATAPEATASAAPPEALAELEAAIEAGDDAAIEEFAQVFGVEALPPYLRPAQ